MKKFVLIIILAALNGLLFAQEHREIKTLFGRDTDVDGFGALDLRVSEINNEAALLIGAYGGVILSKKIMVGAGGYGIATDNQFDGLEPEKPLNLYGGYGGILLGYMISSLEVVHVNFPVLIGAGGMEVSDREEFRDLTNPPHNLDPRIFRIESSAFFVVEPGVEVELNVTRFFRIALGTSYRFTQGVDLPRNQIGDEDISGWTGNLSFKFGGFN